MLETIPFFIFIFLINSPPIILHFLALKYKLKIITYLKWLTLIGLSILWIGTFAYAGYAYMLSGRDDGSMIMAGVTLIASMIVLIPQLIYLLRNKDTE